MGDSSIQIEMNEAHLGAPTKESRMISELQQIAKSSRIHAVSGEAREKLGTFKGVFVPTLQNILGIILFLRLPWITGQAGIGHALAIVLMGCIATTLTSLSMSALATNGVPAAGGCYAIIKSSLGQEFGGTVGLLLFLANTFGIAMYVLGCTEILLDLFFSDISNRLVYMRVIGAIVLVLLFLIVYVGIAYISRAAMFFLTGVLLAIVSIHMGILINSSPSSDPDSDAIPGLSTELFASNFGPKYESGMSFAVMLSIFFPAVTDPLAGSNYSGDLKDPQRSIPPGTLIAVLVTTLIFCMQVVMCGGSVTREELLSNYMVVTQVAWPTEYLIYAGMLLSTLGAGLQSLAGAPRLLSSIADDGLIPQLNFLRREPKLDADGLETGEKEEPRRALILCATLSLACIMLGELNAVAPFITMWFLCCYGIINGACALLAYEHSPNFRPRWKYFDWKVSLLAATFCTVMMFFISWIYALLALSLAFTIYKYIQRHPATTVLELEPDHQHFGLGHTNWQAGMRFDQVRSGLLSLEEGDVRFKYWRPFIIFLCDLAEDGTYIPQRGMINMLSHLMKRGKGLSMVAGVIPGEYRECMPGVLKARRTLKQTMTSKQVEGFAEVITAPSVPMGRLFLIHGKGLGVLRPNTVMLGWPKNATEMDDEAQHGFTALVEDCKYCDKTLILCRMNQDFPSAEISSGYIDVWWVFKLFPANGLLLLFPYLIHQHKIWQRSTVRLFVVAHPHESVDELTENVKKLIRAGGLRLEVHVKHLDEKDAPRYATGDHSNPSGFRESKLTPLMRECSGEAELVFISLPSRPDSQSSREWIESVDELGRDMRRVVFVRECGNEQVQFFNI